MKLLPTIALFFALVLYQHQSIVEGAPTLVGGTTKKNNDTASATSSKTKALLGELFQEKLAKETKDTDVVMTVKEYKKDHCKLIYKTFVISHPRCITEEIVLPVCYGQCNSLYFPGNSFRDTFGLCRSCQPTSKAYKVILLMCPGAKKKLRKRKIEYFKGCACRSCR